jgi:acylphosphatase
MSECVRVIITGRVQGVGYRAWTVETAGRLQLSGWVRNRRDGTVEAVFCGEAAAVTAMFEACKKGPAASRPDSITHHAWDEPLSGPFTATATC